MKKRGLCLALSLSLAGCSGSENRDPVAMNVIGQSLTLGNPDRGAISAASAVLNGAVAQGLVAFDAAGQVEPALAERWIVTSDGLSYIFRIREASWSDGKPVASAEVAQSLKLHMSGSGGNPLRGLFAGVSAVIPMTGQVIEIRLRTPEPNFLQLLAQPEMAISRAGLGTGPYFIHSKRDGVTRLRVVPEPGATATEGVDDKALQSSDIRVRAERMAKGIARFQAGGIKYLTGGTFADLPLANAANPSSTEFQLDAAYGLFGFIVADNGGYLADRDVRTALSIAIDRDTLLQRFGVRDWQTSFSILPLQLDSASQPNVLGIMQEPYRERLLRARALMSGKKKGSIRVAMPEGPGARLLFAELASDWTAIGVSAVRVGMNQPADLRLIDEVAPISSAIWYLRRLSCIPGAICSTDSVEATNTAITSADLPTRSVAIAKADAALVVSQNYIPVALPLRWSLVSPELTGWKSGAFAVHPLRHLRPQP